MLTRLYTHADCLRHDPGAGHAETPMRLSAVLQALDHDRFAALDRVEAPLAEMAQLERVHTRDHIAHILAAEPAQGQRSLDEDTLMSPGSVAAARRAAGAVCAAVDAVLSGQIEHAFCAVRPPGHHATPERAMGFCLFNNIAVGAAHALAVYRLKRVAIVDFDVHHGNGSQDIFADDPRVMYVSSHQSPLYPGTGTEDPPAGGHVLNAMLPPHAGSQLFREVWEERLLPRLYGFKPQLLLVSAGFDAHRLDPLADLELDTEDYAWITHRLVQLAQAHARGRLVSALEGGYHLGALRAGVAAHVAELME